MQVVYIVIYIYVYRYIATQNQETHDRRMLEILQV